MVNIHMQPNHLCRKPVLIRIIYLCRQGHVVRCNLIICLFACKIVRLIYDLFISICDISMLMCNFFFVNVQLNWISIVILAEILQIRHKTLNNYSVIKSRGMPHCLWLSTSFHSGHT